MRFILMHKTDARWEAGQIPDRELITRVGRLMGELVKEKALLGAEGLRASSEGVRLRRSGETWTTTTGPFEGDNELPSGFSILKCASLDEAAALAVRQADIQGDEEIDVRPVTEPWEIGIAPAPANLTARRFMALRKATVASEAGEPLSPAQRAELAAFAGEAKRGGTLLAMETLRPSRRGRRYSNSAGGVSVTDGPFTESKELIAGYILFSADSLEDADRWGFPYLEAVDAPEADLREVEEPGV